MTVIARVFPRRTEATPKDSMAFVGGPPCYPIDVDEVHISVTFTWDLPVAMQLKDEWERVAPVMMGGPALGDPGGEFEPGMYLAEGYTITSRGCPNGCSHCVVPVREGSLREVKIKSGYNVLDNNILACSRGHLKAVFEMLSRQRNVAFTGGLESRLLDDWVVAQLWTLRPSSMFFAYDDAADLSPLIEAGVRLRYADFTRHHCRCYVLIGQPGDTLPAANRRLREAWRAGFLPMAMLWKNYTENETIHNQDWKRLQREWARPAITKAIIRDEFTASIEGR